MSNWFAVQEPESGLEVEDWWQSSLSNMPKGRAKGGHWPFNVHGMEHLEGEISQGFSRRLGSSSTSFCPHQGGAWPATGGLACAECMLIMLSSCPFSLNASTFVLCNI